MLGAALLALGAVGCALPRGVLAPTDDVGLGAGDSGVGDVDVGPPVDGGVPGCGDGLLDPSEGCDDGNGLPGDGCSVGCEVEHGFTCDGAPSTCSASCGDGVIAAAREGCDDMNTIAGDGCTSCTIEPGFTCTGEPSRCMRGCGDGVVTSPEQCDDGADIDGDGCSATCTTEPGYTCTGTPSTCSTRCGDGVTGGREECDDGGTVDGDGCSAACGFEHVHTVTSGPGLGRGVPDNAYDGSVGSMTCVDVTIPAWPLDAVTSVQATLGMSHTWVGDLTIKLVSPTGTVVTLMSRPGTMEGADDGSGMGGDGSNLQTGSPITFVMGATTSSEDMGSATADNRAVCADDGICSYAPSHGAAAAGDLTTFGGQMASGTWRFCVGDGASNDTGTIDRVTLVIGV